MATTKNLCAQISLDLHQKISEAREASPEPEEPPQEENQQDEDALQPPDTPSQGGVEPREGEEGLSVSQDK